MSETQVAYRTNLLQPDKKRATMSTETDTVQQKLRDLKRQLIGVLTTVDALLGDEPSVRTRAERRRG